MWHTGLVALWHVESSRTRDRTRVPCIGRRIHNHYATREAPGSPSLLKTSSFRYSVLFIYLFIHSFIHLAALGLLCCMQACFSCGERGLLWCAGSHCGGFSCCGARALGARALVVAACGLSNCRTWALEHVGFISCGAQA